MEFLTNQEFGLGLNKDLLAVTCYVGNKDFNIPKDVESEKYWLENGIKKEQIYFYDDKKN